jgi:hypothetical protein
MGKLGSKMGNQVGLQLGKQLGLCPSISTVGGLKID